MPTTTILINQCTRILISALGSDESQRPATFKVTVTDYSKGYVNVGGGNQIWYIPRVPGDNSYTITGKSQDGTDLPPTTYNVTATALPVPQATHFEFTAVEVRNQDITTPADPGVDNVSGSI